MSSNDLDIAKMVHEANRKYCEMIGDYSQPEWKDAPDWQRESTSKGIENVRQNPDVTPKESHEIWSEEKIANGWVWGPVKDPEKKEHPCLTVYENLPFEQQVKDSIFISIVKAMLDN